MYETELLRAWKAEEDAAHIHGWDFSHIAGRYTEETTAGSSCVEGRIHRFLLVSTKR